MRKLRLALWLLVAVALFALGALGMGWLGARNSGSVQAEGGLAPGGPLGGAFVLVDHKGEPVTEAVLRETPSAVFFGYTHCPDICPTTLMEMAGWANALGAEAQKMRFVFVTVDPERDTPAVMNEYVTAFSDDILGITGEPEKVRAMLRDYKIPSSKGPEAGSGYAMDHLASVILLDAKGSFVGTIARDEQRDAAIAKLQKLVAG
jgi:protein SCO1/2